MSTVAAGIELVVYKIVGTAPLLMHNPAALEAPKGSKKKSPGMQYDPKDEAEKAAYRNEDGQLVLPSSHFRGGLLAAAAGFKFGKLSGIKLFSASVLPAEEWCLLYHPKTKKPLKEYEIDARRAVVQRASIIRWRPKLTEWACDVVFRVTDELMPNIIEELTTMLNRAGVVSGVGSYRPNCKGPFGTYTAKLEE